MISKYDYFLFDWDGTLVNSLDGWHGALKQSLIAEGYLLNDIDIGVDYQSFNDRSVVLGVENAESIINRAYNYLADHPETVELNEYAITMLRNLKSAGKKLAIVTTSTHMQVDGLLKRFDIEKFFNAVVCADDVENLKPHPEPIESAIKLLTGDKLRTVMVGDSSADMIAASNAGIDSVLYYPPRYENFNNKAELMKFSPTVTISSFVEITGS